MSRPYVYIHTHSSIDGNILTMNLDEFEKGSRIYKELVFNPETQVMNVVGNISGKTSSEVAITNYQTPDLNESAPLVPEGDYIAKKHAPMYYISIDPRGELAWVDNQFTYGNVTSHILEVLTNQVINAYKAFLREKEISYIITGEDELDYELMLEKLYSKFGMERVLISGGGTLNWSFMQRGLVDEISIVLPPIANGDSDATRLFSAKPPYSSIEAMAFKLKDVDIIENDVLWIRYVPKK